jgi:flagellar biosynthesis/type III secretory pathway protein FliH
VLVELLKVVQCLLSKNKTLSLIPSIAKRKKEGRKGGKKEGREERREGGRKEGTKEGRNEGSQPTKHQKENKQGFMADATL